MIDYSTAAPGIMTSRLHSVSAPTLTKKRAAQIKTILVPMDFSRESVRVLEYSVAWARKFDATIHVVNVRPSPEVMAIERAGELMMNQSDAVGFLQDRLAEIQEKHDIKFSPDNCHVLAGRPFEEICKLASGIDADLIILPTRGHSGLKRVLLGSTAERVIRYAPCPVLIPRGKRYRGILLKSGPVKLEIRKILAPVDFSECSLTGVKYAAALAKSFGARLRLLHVVFPYSQIFVPNGANLETQALVASAKQRTQEEMKALQSLKLLRDVKCETKIRVGPTIDEISAESTWPEVDLVVAATHGRSGFRHALIGSVAEQMARYTECPILIVPSRENTNK